MNADPLGLQRDSFDSRTAPPSLQQPQQQQPSQTANANVLQAILTSLVALLSRLMGQSPGGAQPSTTSPLPAGGPQANNPATWNDNNAPYGVTLAGYSPQDHTDLTPADMQTTDPARLSQVAKYVVYNYFLQNQTQPTNDWAPQAAAALNAAHNTNIFHAIDGETLGYGDEYVHSAPNGYGMPQGTYNPSATGELFWGSTSG